MAYLRNSILSINPNQLDAAGQLPTSQKTVIGDYVQDQDNLPLAIDRVGTGSQTWANGEVTMSVTSGQYAIAQTKVCHPYISSHPSLYDITFAGYGLQANVYKRAAFCRGNTTLPYAINDGIYFESDGVAGVFNFVIMKGGVATTIPQSIWNGDKLDGTGTSGITYNFNNFTLLQVDFLYLGGTAVRFFINYGGELILVHTYKHAGLFATTFVNSPYFHIRWEIRSTTGTGTCKQICAAFSVLGGNETVGREFAADLGTAFINANTVGTEYLLLAVRLQSAKLNAYAIPRAISTLSATNDNYLLRVRLNPTIAGAALTWNTIAASSMEFAMGDVAGTNTITATNQQGASYYAVQNQEQLIQRAFLSAIGSTIAGVSDILTLSAIPLTSNLDIYGAINMIEL